MSDKKSQRDYDEYMANLCRLAEGSRTMAGSPTCVDRKPTPAPTPMEDFLSPPAPTAGKVEWKEVHDPKEGVSFFLDPVSNRKMSIKDALQDPEMSARAARLLYKQEATRKKGFTEQK